MWLDHLTKITGSQNLQEEEIKKEIYQMKMKVELKINMITLMEEKVTLANQIEIARLKQSLRVKDELNFDN